MLLQRARKCSIVQEEDDEEDLSSCSGREELAPPHNSLNRRGSRSEGKLNITVQDRIAESERRREHLPTASHTGKKGLDDKKGLKSTESDNWASAITKPVIAVSRPKSAVEPTLSSLKMHSRPNLPTGKLKTPTPLPTHIEANSSNESLKSNIIPPVTVIPPPVVTTIITESSTITIPIHTTPLTTHQTPPKYKTMPSPTRLCTAPNAPQLTLNEIFEESDGTVDGANHTPRQFLARNQNRTTSYEQRRSKFHKTRTASCSSSDASDDDSESRKKRAHKLNNPGKPLPGRRDSHDDSSDSQDPGNTGGTGGSSGISGNITTQGTTNAGSKPETKSGGGSNTSGGGRKNQGNQPMMFGRRHRTGRRRNGETRLRESQSLNRISEVQEDQSHIVISTVLTSHPITCASPKVKSLGARLLQSWSLGSKKSPSAEECNKTSHDEMVKEEKENNKIIDKTGSRKIRLLGKYFQVHKKICIPLPGLFNRNRLYKAQSCTSLTKDIISPATVDSTIFCNEIMKNRPTSVPRSKISNASDINQNLGSNKKGDDASFKPSTVQLNSVCSSIGGICRLHLGDASKCCSLC